MPEYALMDNPTALSFIFYPRKDVTSCPKDAFDLSVPVAPDVSIACRVYVGQKAWPWILFFHGNGEVVGDYDGIAPLYHQRELNLVVTDYRGYGASGGAPTVSHLVQDAHVLVREIRTVLSSRGFPSDLWVMGRSLGSIAALELASENRENLRGLIIESGFSSVVRIVRHLGIPAPGIPLERIDRACVEMIQKIGVPTLILHGERDTLIPLEEAEDLYRHVGAEDKELVVIPSANHNDILLSGIQKYFDALEAFVKRTGAPGRSRGTRAKEKR